MINTARPPGAVHGRLPVIVLICVAAILISRLTVAQGLTGALIGTVKDEQGAAITGAVVRISSPALIGSPVVISTNSRGQLRFSRVASGYLCPRHNQQRTRPVPRGRYSDWSRCNRRTGAAAQGE